MTAFILCFQPVLIIKAIALDNLLKLQRIWTEKILDFFFFPPASPSFQTSNSMRIRNFILLYRIKIVSCDHLSVDSRNIWQRARTFEANDAVTNAGSSEHPFRALQGNADKFAILSFNFPLKMRVHWHLLKKFFQMELSSTFFTVISGPHLLHVSILLGCEDPKQMTWVLYDINYSHWNNCRNKGRTSGTLGRGRKGWNTSYISGISQFPSSLAIQQGYSHLSMAL